MWEFFAGITVAAVCAAIAWGMFRVIDLAVACRRTAVRPVQRRLILLFGGLLLAAGIVWMLGVTSTLLYLVWESGGQPRKSDRVWELVCADLLITPLPISGAVLIAVGTLVGRVRSSTETVKLFARLDLVSRLAWFWLLVAAAAACVATLGGFPLLALFLLVVVLGMHRSTQQDGLVWVLAIAAQKGLPLAGAVSEYAGECHGGYRRRVLELADRLEEGMSLPDALDAEPGLLPAPARVAARMGWEAGKLGAALREVAVARNVRRPVWHAAFGRLMLLILPLIVLQAVGGFMLYFIVPKLQKIYYDFGAGPPEVTRFFVDVADLLGSGFIAPVLFVVQLFLVAALVQALLGRGGYWLQFPFGWVSQPLDRAVIFRALAVWVEGSRPLVTGLTILAEHYPKPWTQGRLMRAVAAISGGASWQESLRRNRLIRRVDAVLLDSAQRLGNLPWVLRQLAERSERRFGNLLQVFNQILFPFVVLGVGALVALFAVAYFSPLVNLVELLAQ